MLSWNITNQTQLKCPYSLNTWKSAKNTNFTLILPGSNSKTIKPKIYNDKLSFKFNQVSHARKFRNISDNVWTSETENLHKNLSDNITSKITWLTHINWQQCSSTIMVCNFPQLITSRKRKSFSYWKKCKPCLRQRFFFSL